METEHQHPGPRPSPQFSKGLLLVGKSPLLQWMRKWSVHFIIGMSFMQVSAQCQQQMLCYRSPVSTGRARAGRQRQGGSRTPSSGILSGDQPPTEASVAAKLANLLPMANAALSAGSGGVYMGDGLPPVLVKLAAKIAGENSLKWGNSHLNSGLAHAMSTQTQNVTPRSGTAAR